MKKFNVISTLFNEVVLSSIPKIHIHIYNHNCKYSFNSYRGITMICTNYQDKNPKKMIEVGEDIFQLLMLLLELELQKN